MDKIKKQILTRILTPIANTEGRIQDKADYIFGCLMQRGVVNEEDKLTGLLTPRDVLQALEIRDFEAVRGRFFVGPEVLHLLTSQYAKDIMSAPVGVHADDGVSEAINTMLDHGFYELPVIDQDMKVVGAISYFDIIINISLYEFSNFIPFHCKSSHLFPFSYNISGFVNSIV